MITNRTWKRPLLACIAGSISVLPLACYTDADDSPSDPTEATRSELTSQIKTLAARYEDPLLLDLSCQSEACTSCDAVAAPAGAAGARYCSSHGCAKKKAGWYFPGYTCASPDTACVEMTQRWIAMPATTTLVRSRCGSEVVVCAQGRMTTATVKDASTGSRAAGYFFEASYAVSAAMGLPPTTIPNAVIYTNPLDPQINLDPRCGACPPGQARCGGVCVDVQSNPAHCGTCGNACAPGTACQGGACACTGGTTSCGGACVDTSNDNSNCGACGVVCGAGKICTSGSCACTGGTTSCGGACVDTSNDNSNCGGCGVVCGSGKTCQSGACQCPSGTTLCGGVCRVDCCVAGDGASSWDPQAQSWGWGCSQSPQAQTCFSCQHDAVCIPPGMTSIICCPNGTYLSYSPNFTGDPLTLCPP